MNRIFYIISAISLLSSTALMAQSLDPTVVINKTYEGKLVDVDKPLQEMEVPDSVTRFDLVFDYSVFDVSYKGTYEFKPYFLNLQPVSYPVQESRFYVKAGAGYSLHPTLDMVWNVRSKERYKMDVYAAHRSYIGKFRSISPTEAEDGLVYLNALKGRNTKWSGYESRTDVGVDGMWDLESFSALYDISYIGIHSKDRSKNRSYDGLDVKFAAKSVNSGRSRIEYDLSLDYRFAEDKLTYAVSPAYVGEHVLDFDAQAAYVLKEGHKVLMDADIDVAAYNGSALSGSLQGVSLVPHFRYIRERWVVDAGIRFTKFLRPLSDDMIFGTREQLIYPDVKAYFIAIPDAMKTYLRIGGGSRVNSYSSLLDRNCHMDSSFGLGGSSIMDLTVENFSAVAGAEGRAGAWFSYDIRAGYVHYGNGLLDAVSSVSEQGILPAVGYASYDKFFTAFDWSADFADFSFDGVLNYTHVWNLDSDSLFTPAPLSGDVAVEYDFIGRLCAGVDCDFASARKAGSFVLPGYADLGVYCEYSLSSGLSFWARGGNLLDMTIQHTPFYAENGINFTAGICLYL